MGFENTIYVLNDYPDELEELTLKILKMFSPNLILGVSDEVPPSADIEKIRFVSEIVQ